MLSGVVSCSLSMVSYFLGAAPAAQAQTLSSLTGNNTAACPASGTLPTQCTTTFTGQVDTRTGVATPEYDRPAGNVSGDDIHSYLTDGTATKIYANFMLGFCEKAGSTYCDNNVQVGYTSNDSATVAAQAEDLIRRHIDGAIMTWEGAGTSEDSAALLFQSYVNSHHCSGAQNCDPMYFIMEDGPSWQYTVGTATGVPNTSNAGCSSTISSTYTKASFENCVVAHLRNDMCYMNGTHWGNNAYQKANGRPILQVFPDEAVIAATGPAPSWADVWVQMENWNNNLPLNCSGNTNGLTYNANNGVPLIVFENAGGFTHTDTAGSFYWVQPAGFNPSTDQFVYNISPATTGGTLDNFFQTALQYPSELPWGAGFKGFNSVNASWQPGRIMDQACGQVWIKSLTEGNKYYPGPALPYLQIGTWNDYNEGTEIESGIDNCYTASGSVSGQTLTWTLNPTNSSMASLSTVSHIEIYDSFDGQNLTLLSTVPITSSSSSTYGLSGLVSGNHQLFVRMVGKNSILNRMSSSIAYSN